MPARSAAVLIAVACAAAAASPESAGALRLVEVARVRAPTEVASPPDDVHRLFVPGKFGEVRLVRDGTLLPTAFLDLAVHNQVANTKEQGLGSIAFAPDYATSGRFYVFYTAPRPGDATGSVLTLEEFRRSAGNPDRADPLSGRTVLTVDHPVANQHNAGQLQFGPDGLLYVPTGDGGGASDPPNNAQNRAVLLGKILRIDPRQSGLAPYTVPPPNPFVGVQGARPEVFDYGLRNPWRLSFDRATGDMAIGDVGQRSWEEVDYLPSGETAGVDFGWRCREGFFATPGLSPPCRPSTRYVPPISFYGHQEGCAIQGGYVSRDLDVPKLYGRYLYGDFCTGEIRSLIPAPPGAVGDSFTGLRLRGLDSFGEDACGHVYATSAARAVMRIAAAKAPRCATTEDGRAPRLELQRARVQKLGPSVRARLRCDERCGLHLSGALEIPGALRPYRLVPGDRVTSKGKLVELHAQIPSEAEDAARRALDRGEEVRVVLGALAHDAAGNADAPHSRVVVLR